jgi:hypothetical protein
VKGGLQCLDLARTIVMDQVIDGGADAMTSCDN